MKVVVQRVKNSSVCINSEIFSSISKGLLLFVAIEKNDTTSIIQKMAQKILFLRIFEDENDLMNKSILDIKGEILCISQFTLAASLEKGNRPSFDLAEKPEVAKEKFALFVEILKNSNLSVKEGKFQENMLIKIENYGPVTFVLHSSKDKILI